MEEQQTTETESSTTTDSETTTDTNTSVEQPTSNENVTGSESAEQGITSTDEIPDTLQVITDLERTEETILVTGDGTVHIIHEITLGDIIISTLLVAILVFMVLDRFIRRY